MEARIRSVLLVRLDELGVLEVLLGEAGGHLGDDGAGDGEAGEEGPAALPLPPEEHRPRIEAAEKHPRSRSPPRRPRCGWGVKWFFRSFCLSRSEGGEADGGGGGYRIAFRVRQGPPPHGDGSPASPPRGPDFSGPGVVHMSRMN